MKASNARKSRNRRQRRDRLAAHEVVRACVCRRGSELLEHRTALDERERLDRFVADPRTGLGRALEERDALGISSERTRVRDPRVVVARRRWIGESTDDRRGLHGIELEQRRRVVIARVAGRGGCKQLEQARHRFACAERGECARDRAALGRCGRVEAAEQRSDRRGLTDGLECEHGTGLQLGLSELRHERRHRRGHCVA